MIPGVLYDLYDSWSCSVEYVYCNLDNFYNINFQPEDSPNRLGLQSFGPSTWPKTLSFLFL